MCDIYIYMNHVHHKMTPKVTLFNILDINAIVFPHDAAFTHAFLSKCVIKLC